MVALLVHPLTTCASANRPAGNFIRRRWGEVKSVHEASEAAWDPAFPAPKHPVLGATTEGARGGEGEGVEGAGHTATRLSVQP